MFRRFDDIFQTCGWRVVTLKHGKLQRAAFRQPGGRTLEERIENCPNADYAALTFLGGAAWREPLVEDIGSKPNVPTLLASFDDEGLATLMTNLGGHCVETLAEAFDDNANDDTPTLFIAYTVKGWGLPLAGHKDNHSGMMNGAQIEQLRSELGIAEGDEWEPRSGLGANAAAQLRDFAATSALARRDGEPVAAAVPVPDRFKVPAGKVQSTQAAFGRILFDITKSGEELATG